MSVGYVIGSFTFPQVYGQNLSAWVKLQMAEICLVFRPVGNDVFGVYRELLVLNSS